MVQYENIRQMSLEELLKYHNALKSICERYEFELRPLYNSSNPKDQTKWVEVNNELQHAKLYFDVVLDALKYKAFHGLDEYEPAKRPVEEKKKPIPKKPVTSARSGKPKKVKDSQK